MKLSRIGIITHPEVGKEIVHELVKKLKRKGLRLFFDPLAAGKISEDETNVRDMDIDLAIILGGDGTLLWSINELRSSPLILGINTGRIGYLTELDSCNLNNYMEKLLAGDFLIDERAKLSINNRYEVLNELVILPQRPAALLEFRITIGKEKIEFRSDGVLVSTQTGSTGHALSLGGPVIYPDANVYLVAPVIPFMQEQSPLIVPDNIKTTIELLGKKKNACLVLDGNVIKKIRHSEKIVVEKSKNTVRFVRFTDRRWKQKIKH